MTKDDPEDHVEPVRPGQIAEFEREFGEPLNRILDLQTWSPGTDIQALYARLEHEVAEAIAQEDRIRDVIRETIFPKLSDPSRRDLPPFAGVRSISVEDLERIHRRTLFPGHVEACDGTRVNHDSLAMTVIQLGICLVSYEGQAGTWSHRLYRRDLRARPDNPVDEALQLIEARQQRSSVGIEGGADQLSELATRGIMTYAERAVLTRLSGAAWRMGQGNPAPYEILTGAGAVHLVGAGLAVLRDLLLRHRQFVFVSSAPRHRALLTIGMALRPLEFAVVHYLKTDIEEIVTAGNLRGAARDDALDFVETAGRAVAVGVYRASATAPPFVFYAPSEPDLCAQAAAIVIADASLQEHRGYPLLLDLADQFCQASFARNEFIGVVQSVYAAHGRPIAYLSERETRSR